MKRVVILGAAVFGGIVVRVELTTVVELVEAPDRLGAVVETPDRHGAVPVPKPFVPGTLFRMGRRPSERKCEYNSADTAFRSPPSSCGPGYCSSVIGALLGRVAVDVVRVVILVVPVRLQPLMVVVSG